MEVPVIAKEKENDLADNKFAKSMKAAVVTAWGDESVIQIKGSDS